MNLFISFSGGKTSAYMTKWLLDNKRDSYDDIVILFANTGQENEETLVFVNECDKRWGLGVVWVEAVVNPIKGNGGTFKVVNFETASRDGRPFEDVIRKYGIPNQVGPFCTQYTKLAPMTKYLRSLGWKKGSYETALGIRADEMDRVSSKMNKEKLIYPLCEDTRQTKETIKKWWLKQDFTLELPEHKGNCSWCWKKSKRKLLTLAAETPEIFEFPAKMEELYGVNSSHSSVERRVFFRGNMSTKELLEESKSNFTHFVENTSVNIDLFDDLLDSANGCSESCEVY